MPDSLQQIDPRSIATELAAWLASTAVERDRAGGHAGREREAIRASGLLALSIPVDYGGAGADWPTVYATIRILAQADSALAHVYGFHHLQLAGLTLYGSAAQRQRLLTATVRERLFWGNALNPLDKRTVASASADGFVLDGIKSFSSGSVGADWLTVSAWDHSVDGALIAVLPASQPGISVHPDWDAFGQRQTDSGNVRFEQVALPADLVLQAPGQVPTAQASLRSQVAQLIMANLYLGIGQGAFAAARTYTKEQARAWFAAGVDKATDDPLLQHRYGKLWLLLRPAELAVDHAAVLLDQAYRRGAALTGEERGLVAIAVAEAKALAHQAGLEISSQMFELTGARSTSAQFGFDRFWRNVRVHTLHDPIDYKIRDLGRYALDGSLPQATAYS
ncbi:acyl-CoA dehydrogenase family protein [Massilia sp. PWRC2]|uniref:acyl-CoA dehydrogenase family protein n=1 Tax=Massilia sp. PWRC2 TaxID=2804626 RepID=UPI003CF4E16B